MQEPCISVPLSETCLSGAFRRYLTAGIVCFAIDPVTRNIYVLLGREAPYERDAYSNGVWCDFGGHTEPGETPEHAAAREFTEESMCIVRLFGDSAQTLNAGYIPAVEQMLHAKHYYLKITISIPPAGVNQQHKVYYLLEVPWQPETPTNFGRARQLFVDIQNQRDPIVPFAFRSHPGFTDMGVNRHYLEKHDIRWWGLQRLASVLQNRGQYRGERFRRGFLAALRIIVRQLQSVLC